MDIFELTVTLETNIKNANTQKINILSQIKKNSKDVSVHPFEIGSRGYISPSNKANLKFCKPSVNFKDLAKLIRLSVSF